MGQVVKMKTAFQKVYYRLNVSVKQLYSDPTENKWLFIINKSYKAFQMQLAPIFYCWKTYNIIQTFNFTMQSTLNCVNVFVVITS